LDKLGKKYKDARIKKDTVLSLVICDSIVTENELLAVKLDNMFSANKAAATGFRETIHTQKILIDTLTGQNKRLTIDNSRLVTISNENADKANKAIKKNKRLSLLTRIEAGAIIALGVLFAITN